MQELTHLSYLDKNQLKLSLLPDPIQDKIDIYTRMEALRESIEPGDQEELDRQLDILDLEIIQDIQETYKDRLRYNSLKHFSKSQKKKSNSKKQIPKEETPVVNTDEVILKQLVDQGKHRHICRTALRKLGLKAALGDQTIIGSYRIHRISVFSYCYRIVPM